MYCIEEMKKTLGALLGFFSAPSDRSPGHCALFDHPRYAPAPSTLQKFYYDLAPLLFIVKD